ncbi:hypothetical protein Pmani_011536 [Petrolisthes manimaculis]|uniref:Uncharacterized protein n=1 Tax=Petrolisthes manimaculis TaxID=1843537 RepID=A0AAE1UG37_9EUCA|nr:hypothetical protein Pmani_011536 [Petrolisthes manimaculis]
MPLATPRSSTNRTASLLTTHISPPRHAIQAPLATSGFLHHAQTRHQLNHAQHNITSNHLLTTHCCGHGATQHMSLQQHHTSLHYTLAPVNGFSTMSDFITTPAALPQQLPATTPHRPPPPVSGGPGIG